MADPKNKSTTNRRGTRGFGSSSGCWWPQNTGNDFAVRGKDQHKRYNNRQQSYCIDWQLVCKSGSAGQLQNVCVGGGMSQKKWLIYFTWQKRREIWHVCPTCTGISLTQEPTASWRHTFAGVVQRDTDGHTAVIGHHRQEEALSGSEDKEEAHLCGTVQDRYPSALSPKIHQNPRESDGHITDFQGGKICQEKNAWVSAVQGQA